MKFSKKGDFFTYRITDFYFKFKINVFRNSRQTNSIIYLIFNFSKIY